MAQFDVYRNPDRESSERVPYLLDVQTGLLDRLSTRVVVPLMDERHMIPARRLNPVFTVEGHNMVMATADLAAIHRRHIGERVASLDGRRDEIIAAIDFLITGI